MPPRFYCPTLAATGPATLTGTEAHHAAHVLRLSAGDPIELFNGQGLVGSAVIDALRKHEALCQVTSVSQEPPPAVALTLATAVPKGDRFDWLIEKATELGVTRLVPLITARSSVDPRASKLDRLRQTIIAACKQSRRAELMELTSPMTWAEFLADGDGQPLYVADPGGMPLAGPPLAGTGRFAVAVGPEGGFTPDELSAAAECGGQLVNLGRRLLRVETAGLALAVWGLMLPRNPGPSDPGAGAATL